ncbi:MAG TPA: ATP-binding protein [Polyangiaceae bacterium]|nr:ATP-binding protein [Polyangiaceae bacterium]
MRSTTLEQVEVRTEEQVVKFRQLVRKWSTQERFSLVDQTKLVTAASEIARNTVVHGGGGEGEIQLLEEGPRRGLRLILRDRGVGIENPELALRDGYTTGGGLGLGLGGAKRLVNEFELESRPGEGTRIALTGWK